VNSGADVHGVPFLGPTDPLFGLFALAESMILRRGSGTRGSRADPGAPHNKR
jgi:hypothetical protein